MMTGEYRYCRTDTRYGRARQ